MYQAIYPYITMRLQDSADKIDVTGGDLDNEIASVIRKTLQVYGVVYADMMPGNDLDNFNEAVALLVCARVLTPLSTGGLNYDLVSEEEDGVGKRFGNRSETTAGGEKERWELEAARCLALISFIQTQAPPLTTFAVGGPCRPGVEIYGQRRYD